MSFKVVNRIDRDFRWDNGSNPYGFNIPFPTTEDNGKVLSVVEGNYSLAETSSGPTYTAGTNIQISDANVISATDTKYTAGANINISASNVISAVLPTRTKDLLWAQTNQIITDGWTNVAYGIQPEHDIFTYYDEIIVELAPVQNMSAGNDALSKGGMYIDSTHSVNKQIVGRRTIVPSDYPVYPDNPFVFDNLSIYSPTIGDPNTKVNYNVTFYIDKDSDGYYFLRGICNASSITATLWANCAYYCYGIKY